jgi:hypothetical protein
VFRSNRRRPAVARGPGAGARIGYGARSALAGVGAIIGLIGSIIVLGIAPVLLRPYSHRSCRGASRIRSSRTGTPATTALAGTSLLTTV